MIDLLIVVIVLASINLLFSIFNIVHRHYLKESDALVWIAVLKENAELKTKLRDEVAAQTELRHEAERLNALLSRIRDYYESRMGDRYEL